MPTTVLVITKNPKNPELLEACQYLEGINYKIWIETFEPSLNKDDWFSWLIIDLVDDSSDIYELINLVKHDRISFITNNYFLISKYNYLEIYSSWKNLLERNFFI